MALRVVNGAISWEGATLQIRNIADIRKFEKRYVRDIPLPHSEESISQLGKIVLFTGLAYLFHFFFSWEWSWYIHLICLAITIGGGYLLIKFKSENSEAPTQEVKYGYFICIEKNSGSKEYFGSDNEHFIRQLYDNVSLVMHDNRAGTNISLNIDNINHFENIEGSTLYNNSFNESK